MTKCNRRNEQITHQPVTFPVVFDAGCAAFLGNPSDPGEARVVPGWGTTVTAGASPPSVAGGATLAGAAAACPP